MPEWIERLIRDEGLSSPAAVQRVEQMRVTRVVDNTARLKSMYDFTDELKKLRKGLAENGKVCEFVCEDLI